MCHVNLNILLFVFQTAVLGMERRGRRRVMEWEGEQKREKKCVFVRHSCTVCMAFQFRYVSCGKKGESSRPVDKP